MNRKHWCGKALLGAVGLFALLVTALVLYSSLQWINGSFPGFFLYGNVAVGPDSLPEWSGRKAGLRFLDRIVAVQGEINPHSQAVYDLVRAHPPGRELEYRVARGGKTVSVRIPTIRFSFYDWLLSFGVYLLVGVGFLAIGFAPFYLGSVSPAALPLFFMASTIFFWFSTTFDFVTTQLLPKEVRIFAFTLTPSAGIHLGLLLTQGRHRRKGHLLYLSLIYGISILLGLFYSLAFYGPPEVWHLALRFSYGYSCLASLVFLGLVYAALRRPVSQLERSRLRVVLVGAFLGFFLPTFGTVLASLFFLEIPYNLLLIPTVFFPLSVAYALLKYSLFDLGNVLKVGLTRGALTGVLLLIYVLVVSLLSLSIGIYEKGPLVPLFFSILVVLVFNPLLRWIEGLVDRCLYRREYDPNQLQGEVSFLLRTLSRPQVLGEKYLRLVTDRVGIQTGLLFFRTQEKEKFLEIGLNGHANGFKEIPHQLSSLWAQNFWRERKGISRDEVETDPLYDGSRDEFLGILGELRSELLISLTFEEDVLGFLCLGERRSRRGYSADDLKLLCHLADQLALALENGILFEESEKAKESYQLLYDQSQGLNKKLIEVDQLKKQFVANISHELRTPISTILGYTEVLLDPGFTGNTRTILERVVTNGQDLSQLMDSLLDFSRVEAGALGAAIQKVRLHEIFQPLEMMARRLIKGRPIRFRGHVDASLDEMETDPKKLYQILTHLLTNALKFTERGEIAIEAAPFFEEGAEFLAIAVSDTGIGISRRDQEVIFEEFRQLDGSSTRRYGGTGVGLSLCTKLAQSLGGRVEVESEPGQGSTFTLILPLGRSQVEAVSGFSAQLI